MAGVQVIALAGLLVAAPPAQVADDTSALRHRLRVAEDARAPDQETHALLVAAAAHADVVVRLQAIRAVGRLERASSIPVLAPALDDASIEVRIEAAHALAQSAGTASDAVEVSRLLRRRLADEQDGGVRGALATSVGRLPHDTEAERALAVDALTHALGMGDARVRPSTFAVVGVARGAASLARGCARQQTPCAPLVPVLEQLLRAGVEPLPLAPAMAARVRRLAASGLTALDVPSADVRRRLLGDADAEVRRLAVLALAEHDSASEAMALEWLDDEAMVVRHAVAQRAGRRWQGVAERALADPSAHVRLAAIDALGDARGCAPCAALVQRTQATDATWHTHVHALVALARTDAAEATRHITDAARSLTWQTRMYAARAAAEADQVALLRELARDMHPNVREVALTGLAARQHRDSDDLRREALDSGDHQLVLTAARTLAGTPERADAQRALLSALTRLTREARDTSRDPRVAILDRLEEVGDETLATALRPWLTDFDEAVARRAAAIITARSAQPVAATPVPGRREGVPTEDGIARLDGQLVTLSLTTGDVVIRLAAREAPTNVARFARQVEAGAWNGLTFHRVEPGFVVQGGSPGANEYVGADLYTRDERGPLSHVRGAVGISTRGRDTGDGQIFINLVDNARLDHAYTIIGTVVAGMPLVDDMLEGATIVEARLAPR